MKKKLLKIKASVFKYLLFTPLLLLTLCQTNDDTISLDSQKLLTKDAKVISLMKDAIKSDLQKTLSKSEGINDANTQCTHFLYPMTFEVYSGDDPNPQIMEINSDDELIAFIDTLNTSNQFYIFFPITLLDGDGVETIINDLVELEGTLQMAVDACAGFNNDDSNGDPDADDNNDDLDEDDDSDHNSNHDSDDNSDDDSDSNHDSDNSSDDDSDSNHDSDSSSDDDSDSNHDSDNSSDDDSDSNHHSDSSSDDDSSSNHDDDSSDDHSDDVSNDDHDEYQYCQDNNKKVYICHNGVTICVSVNAIWGHMTHHEDDYLGRCEE